MAAPDHLVPTPWCPDVAADGLVCLPRDHEGRRAARQPAAKLTLRAQCNAQRAGMMLRLPIATESAFNPIR